ncbi:MAG: LON peptidase substrate-binding domain-containing protein, partial [Bacteroidetes bacterium]|nr:LON peptidase substrate-binding domain-containing protein [Bacteroidota bacterium]
MKKKTISSDLEIDLGEQMIPIITTDQQEKESIDMPENLPILALRSSALFPGAVTPVTIDRDKSIKLIKEMERENKIFGAILQNDPSVEEPDYEDFYKIGTAARLLKVLEMPNGNLTAILHGLQKFEVEEFISKEPYFTAKVTPLADKQFATQDDVKYQALIDSIKDIAINIINLSPSIPNETIFAIKNLDNNKGIINFVSSNIDFSDEDRQSLLEAPGVYARANKLLELLVKEQHLLTIKNELQMKVKQEIDVQQKEYYLQQQLRVIQEELGGDPADNEIIELRARGAKKKWKKEVAEIFAKELSKLERMNPAVAEFNTQMNYLQLMLDLPWGKMTKDNINLKTAQKHLDKDHFGLEDVKSRIIEHL